MRLIQCDAIRFLDPKIVDIDKDPFEIGLLAMLGIQHKQRRFFKLLYLTHSRRKGLPDAISVAFESALERR